MKDYSYIGVAMDLVEGVKFIVRSKSFTMDAGNIVKFNTDDGCVCAEVLHSAFVDDAGTVAAIIAEFGNIYDVSSIYSLDWTKEVEANA